MDSTLALARFKKRHRDTLAQIADRGTMLDQSDINEFLDLSLPGMDEVMALFELSEYERQGIYSHIIVDTAPSGHTTRLLKLPQVFSHWIGGLYRMSDKHRFLVSRFGNAQALQQDPVELFLTELVERLERVRSMLYDPAQAAFTLVTIPEAMSIDETSRYLKFLRDEGIPVTHLIVNRVENNRSGCSYCQARAKAQSPHLKRIAREFRGLEILQVPLLPDEVRGVKGLRTFAELAWQSGADIPLPKFNKTSVKGAVAKQTGTDGFDLEPRRLLVFGGKGGVGKTTSAAAAAIALAEVNQRSQVLVLSTDPAHSLSDSLGEQIGRLKKRVAKLDNLDASEIDPSAQFEEFKNRYQKWVDGAFESLTSGSRWEVQFDREAIRELVMLAPPGVDEIAALSTISGLLQQGSYSSIVLDTAPTGHLIRFLELPEIALSWVRALMKLLLKYKDVMRADELAQELVVMSRNIKRVRALFTNEKESEFVVVSIPERMALEETVRLVRSLKRLKIPIHRLLVNNVIPGEAAVKCRFCSARSRLQQNVLEQFKTKFKNKTLFCVTQKPRSIQGTTSLRHYFRSWQTL
jgi:arsenite-transporting ATPase